MTKLLLGMSSQQARLIERSQKEQPHIATPETHLDLSGEVSLKGSALKCGQVNLCLPVNRYKNDGRLASHIGKYTFYYIFPSKKPAHFGRLF